MIKYSLAVNPYSVNNLAADSAILINRFLVSNICLLVKKEDWENSWYREGWRPVEVYGVSNESDFITGDLVWCKALGISNYAPGPPKWIFKKVVMRPGDLPKMSADRISALLGMGESLSLEQLQKPTKVKI